MEEFEEDVGECFGKKCFNKKTAELILKKALENNKSKQWRRECRIYKCPKCTYYHLTSKDKGGKPKEFKKKFTKQWKRLMN